MSTQLRPYDIENFTGLNLARDVTQVAPNAAIDLLNVDFDHTGVVRSRDGFTPFSAATGRWGSLHGAGDGVLFGYSSVDAKMHTISPTGSALASSSTFGGILTTGIATIGTPSAVFTYITSAYPAGGTYRYNHGTNTWGAGAAAAPLFLADHLAVSPLDNRLAIAVNQPKSQVSFSDAGDPETYGANNFIYLTPGDGEQISAMVTWRDYLFVFKQTKFFVFYGQSVDATGQPIFNYRSYVGTGAMTCQGAAVAARDGVYFITNDGVWRTTGGDPERVSGDIDLLFRDPAALEYWTGSSRPPDQSTRLGFWNDRVFLSWDTSGASTGPYATLVYSTARSSWTYWNLDAAHVTNVSRVGTSLTVADVTSRAMFGSALTTGAIMRIDPTLTTDNGAQIATRYRSGFFRLGPPAEESTIRETQVMGGGSLPFGWTADFGTPQTQTTLTLGTIPQLARVLHRDQIAGEFFSYTLGGPTAGDWITTRVVPLIRDTRGEGEMSR